MEDRSDERLVVWKGLVRTEHDDMLSLYHPGHGTSLDVEEESRAWVEEILAGFETPQTSADFLRAHPEVPSELLDLMARSFFVVQVRELPFLEHGFLRPAASPVGQAWAYSDLPDLAIPGGFAVVGVPVDFASMGAPGARCGPSEIRKVLNGPLLTGEGDVLDYELNRLYPSLTPQIADLGDIEPDGARLDHVGARLGKVVRELLRHEMRPLILGGDHSITHFVLGELIEQVARFGIIHFDAHHDMLPSRTLSHANIFSHALNSPRVEHLVQIGVRSLERVSPYASRVARPKRTVVTARNAARGEALKVLEALPRNIPYYLTFDIDCIDAAIARETGTPAFGGLTVELALELVDYVARTFHLLGADFVEVSAAQNGPNAAALISASLLTRVVMGDSEFEELPTDSYTFGD